MSETETIPKIIFIIPYRNREPQLNHFKYYMKYILEDLPNNYEIFFIHQCDSKPFNRGAMKNIGFIAMKNKYPNHYKTISFVFNDIDTLPAFKNMLNYETTTGVIKHFYGFEFALGGIISVTGYDFEKINGFPNYWGWGLEDNDLQIRANQYQLKIDRSNFYEFNNPNIINIQSEKTRVHSKQQVWRAGIKNTEGITDIKNLNYDINIDMVDMVNVLNFETNINPYLDTYANIPPYQNITTDIKFKPFDAVNNVNELINGGVKINNISNVSKFNNRGLHLKLFNYS